MAKFKTTRAKRNNLKAWMNFLLFTDLKFNMATWWAGNNPSNFRPSAEDLEKGLIIAHNCGTVACAAGWATFVVKPLKKHFAADGQVFMYQYLADKFFGGFLHSPEVETFVTSCEWRKEDNTKLGAAFRIHCVLNMHILTDYEKTPYRYFRPYFKNFTDYRSAKAEWLAKLPAGVIYE